MKLTLGQIDFEVTPVPEGLRTAIMSDPLMAGGRNALVWSWDKAAGTGTARREQAPDGSFPMPNGLGFFVPRMLSDGAIVKNEKTSKAMMERFLNVIGAGSLPQILKAIQPVLKIPRKKIPHAHFEPLRPLTTFDVVMQTEYSVVELKDASRNLSAHLFVPGQVRFIHQLPEDAPDTAKEATTEKAPTLLVPTFSKANHHVRLIALTQRARELEPRAKAMIEGETDKDPRVIVSYAGVIAELKGLAPAPPMAANV